MATSGGVARPATFLEAILEEQRRWLRRALAVPRVLEAAVSTRVGTTPSTVVLREGTHQLRRYVRETPATQAEPVLFCYALVNRPYILDLEPDRSVIRQYLDRGFDVYLIDWGAPTHADRGLTLTHYVCWFLSRAIDAILRAHDQEKLHLLGYCMGGTMAAALGGLRPDVLKTLTLLAAPIDFSGGEALLNLWTDRRVFDVDRLVDTYGNCPGWFLQSCFLAMNPIRNFLEKPLAFYEQMDDPRAMTSHFALERWLNDNIPVAGETFREFVKKLYQRNELVQGQLHLGGQRVDLKRITCPLLLLTAKADHLAPPPSTEGIRPHVGASEIVSMQAGGGHVGLVVGGRAHARFWPDATRWTAERSTPASGAAPDPTRPAAARAATSAQQPTM